MPLASAQDYKRIFDDDEGPNTGGMGSYSPVPSVDDARARRSARRCTSRYSTSWHGVASRSTACCTPGLMMTAEGFKVLEFNVRFGDPETQAILPRLRTDLLALLEAATVPGGLDDVALEWAPEMAVTVVLASEGYPASSSSGDVITGLAEVAAGVFVTHAGTATDSLREARHRGRARPERHRARPRRR